MLTASARCARRSTFSTKNLNYSARVLDIAISNLGKGIMAEEIQGRIPKAQWKKKLPEETANRLRKRRLALDTLRQQVDVAEHRLRADIFNVWRTGEGTMAAIGEACGYTKNWISTLISRIREDDELLEDAVKQAERDKK